MSRKLLSFTHYSLLITHHCIKPAADEMDNLDAVAFGEFGVGPIGAADNLAITLDGEARGRERKLVDKFAERRALLHFAALAVDFDAQTVSNLYLEGRMMRRISASWLPATTRMRIAARPDVKRGSVVKTTAIPSRSVVAEQIKGRNVVPRTLTVTAA